MNAKRRWIVWIAGVAVALQLLFPPYEGRVWLEGRLLRPRNLGFYPVWTSPLAYEADEFCIAWGRLALGCGAVIVLAGVCVWKTKL